MIAGFSFASRPIAVPSHAYPRRPFTFISQPLILAAIFSAPAISLPLARAAVVDPLANGPVDPELFTGGPAAKPTTVTPPLPHQPQQQDVRPANYQTNVQPPASGKAEPLPAPASRGRSTQGPWTPSPASHSTNSESALPNPPANCPPTWLPPAGTKSISPAAAASPLLARRGLQLGCHLLLSQSALLRRDQPRTLRLPVWRQVVLHHLRPRMLLPPTGRIRRPFLRQPPRAPLLHGRRLPRRLRLHPRPLPPRQLQSVAPALSPCDPLAAAAEGGVWTGLIFAIP